MSEDLKSLAEEIIDYCNATEAAAVKLRMNVEKLIGESNKKPEKTWSWNPDGIKWVQAKGARGDYERYPAEDQKIEATPDYKNMLQDLKEHKMFLFRDGLNYWVFPDLAICGRKQKEVF
jgi:hypothetical protein